MPKLILSVDDKVVDEITIDKDTVTIGRRTDNDICLDNLAISGYHSQITTVLNDSFLEDLNSTNGTFVNSKIIKKHALKDGDIIDIGNHRIKYINHLATSSANSEFEKTVVMTPSNSENNIDESIADLENQINAISDGSDEPEDNSIDNSEEAKEGPVALIDAIYDGHEDTSLKFPSMDMSASAEPEPEKESSQEEPASKETSVEELDSETHIEEESISDEPMAKETTSGEPALAKTTSEDSTTNKQPPNESQSSESVTNPNEVGRIQILSGSNCGKELILDKKLTTLGKPEVAVVGITKRSSGYFIVHIDGSEDHPSKLNGDIIKGRAQPIEDHDIIDVAGIKLEFFLE